MTDFTGFDPKSLLTTTVKAKLDTKLPEIPLDEGDEFPILCRKVDTRIITSQKAATAGNQYVAFDSDWEILDERVKEKTHLESPRARYSFILEVDPVHGLLIGPAKNIKLGRLLEAVGLSGKSWSLSMIEGLTAYGKVRHRPDDDDPEIVYNEITRITASPRR